MNVEKLDFQHKDLLSERFKKIGIFLSSYSFPNLYLYRKEFDYEVVFDKKIFVKGKSYDGFTYMMPTVSVLRIEYEYLKSIAKDVDFLFPIAEEWLNIFKPEDFEYSYGEDEIDYIYTVDKISTYAGRKLQKKRNLLKQFVTTYQHNAYPLTNDRLADAHKILDAWQAETGEPLEKTDYYQCQVALNMYDDLVLCGGIYYVGSEPVGFIIGEEINQEMFVLHFAKGKREYKGLYQYMYNTFAKILPRQYKYLNFEEDLGKETLKIAKSSYVPDMMLKKYRVKVI